MKHTIAILGFFLWLILPVQAFDEAQPLEQPFQHSEYPAQSPADNSLINKNNDDFPFMEKPMSRAGGPTDDLPNDNEGGGGWVGMPNEDAYYFLLILAIGYGVIKRKNITN